MTFIKWFESHEWWHYDSRYEGFSRIWDTLSEKGVDPDTISDMLDAVVSEMRDEYGE